MANRDILAVGTSAGGVEALIHVAKGLPRNLPASVLLTIHLPGHARSALDDVLTRAGPLPASFAEDGEVVRKSRIYIAPPDRHLLLDGDHITVVQDPKDAAFTEPLARSIGYELSSHEADKAAWNRWMLSADARCLGAEDQRI